MLIKNFIKNDLKILEFIKKFKDFEISEKNLKNIAKIYKEMNKVIKKKNFNFYKIFYFLFNYSFVYKKLLIYKKNNILFFYINFFINNKYILCKSIINYYEEINLIYNKDNLNLKNIIDKKKNNYYFFFYNNTLDLNKIIIKKILKEGKKKNMNKKIRKEKRKKNLIKKNNMIRVDVLAL